MTEQEPVAATTATTATTAAATAAEEQAVQHAQQILRSFSKNLPLDIYRSLVLIWGLNDKADACAGELDHDARLLRLNADQSVDYDAVRKRIASVLDDSFQCRASSLAEASRVYDAVTMHLGKLNADIAKMHERLGQMAERDAASTDLAKVSSTKTRQLDSRSISLNEYKPEVEADNDALSRDEIEYLRKRLKKNSAWTPSPALMQRELLRRKVNQVVCPAQATPEKYPLAIYVRSDRGPIPARTHRTTDKRLIGDTENEPTFCKCRDISYGDMVACDNESCPYEWFHFGCVGLTAAPPEKWYCESCKKAMKKRRR